VTTTNFFIPRSIDEAVALLGKYGSELVVIGGGTIVMQRVNDGLLFPRQVMSLKRAEMNQIQQVNNHVEIGAAVTPAQLTQLTTLPILAAAARVLGTPAIRTMATIGGNLFAKPPYSDLSVPLLALDAHIALRSDKGQRRLPLTQFFSDRERGAIGCEELVTALQVPHPQGRSTYLKLGRRLANTPSVVAVAVHVVIDDANAVCTSAHIALGGAGPHPTGAARAESALIGKRLDEASIAAAADAAMGDSDPLTDALASSWYRRKMIGLYVRRALESLKQAT